MATIVTKIVDPDNGAGTDYTSLSAWEAGEQKDLVAADEIAVASCRCSGGSADTVPCTIHGWVGDSTHGIKIWTDPALGNRHSGVWDSTKYRMQQGAGSAFHSWDSYVQVIGLQFQALSGAFLFLVIFDAGRFDKNILRGPGKSESIQGLVTTASTCWRNNIIYDFYNGFLFDGSGGYPIKTIYAYNNVAYNCYYGFRNGWPGQSQRFVAKNCIAQNCDVCYYGCEFGESAGYPGHNISDDGTATGTGSKTYTTVQFLDLPNKNFHLHDDDTAACDAGINLSAGSYSFADDIDGDLRPDEGAWDIGADERVYIPPPPPPPPAESLITPGWKQGIKIKRAWKTTIQQSITGKEKRSALFTWPRKSIQYRSIVLTSKEINWLKRKLYMDAANVWNMPFWVDWVTLTAEAAQGANTLAVDDTRYRAFQNGKNCALVENYLSFEIIEILSFTQTIITLSVTLENTWPAGTLVYPAITARTGKGQNKVSMITDRAGRADIAATEVLE